MKLDIHEFAERDLIERVMRNMRGTTRAISRPRWALVRDAFGVGSTVARALCHEFNMNPDEELKK